MAISLDVFNRTGSSSISSRTFYGLVAIFISSGLLANFIITGYLISIGFTMGWLGIILSLIVAIGGIILCRAEKPILSLLGYALIVGAMSFVMGTSLKGVSGTVIQNAVLLTLAVTLIMGTAGVIFPDFFSRIGPVLFIALCSLLVIRIVGIFWPAFGHMGIWDYLAAGIFSLYIGYDMWRASSIEHSFQNTIDVSVNLYLDIINLFSSLVNILGDND
jgi:FtsH-binding integral membrane protein